MADGTPRRLAADERKAAILNAAITLLARDGLDGFSLEAVAREAGVALSLPRHYFGGYRDLLKAATEGLLQDVEDTLLGPQEQMQLPDRITAYLDLLAKNPWGHHVWMRSAEIHPEIHAVVRKARQRMAEAMHRRPWDLLSQREQIDARGWIGYVESVVADWLERGTGERDAVVELILNAIGLPAPSGRSRSQAPAAESFK